MKLDKNHFKFVKLRNQFRWFYAFVQAKVNNNEIMRRFFPRKKVRKHLTKRPLGIVNTRFAFMLSTLF